MRLKSIGINIFFIVVFIIVAITLSTVGVKSKGILEIFLCGVVVGASMRNVIIAMKVQKKAE